MTRAELNSAPDAGHGGAGPTALIDVAGLDVQFRTPRGMVQAVSEISFSIAAGETLGIVGESGSGKSTTARSIMALTREARGKVHFEGAELLSLSHAEMRRHRPDLQLIFQDPIASLNPRHAVNSLVGEGLQVWPERVEGSIESDVTQMLARVGLSPAAAKRRPAELSGGQCQRVAVARALVLKPKLLVCDEAVSALDVSIQAQILNLLRQSKEEFGLTMAFISHDLGVVKNVSDRIMVMYLGKICEIASTERLHEAPVHPYTQLLLSSVPSLHQRPARLGRPPVTGIDPPSPLNPPSGCRFRTRCPYATEQCAAEEPRLIKIAEDHLVACHHATETLADWKDTSYDTVGGSLSPHCQHPPRD